MSAEDEQRLSQWWPPEQAARIVAWAKARGISTASAVLVIVIDRLDQDESKGQ